MSIINTFSVRETILQGDGMIKDRASPDDHHGFGVLLDRANIGSDWLEVGCRNGNRLEVTLVATLGNKSRVMGRVALLPGEGHIFGRREYSWMHTTAQEHVELRAVRVIAERATRLGVAVTDLGSDRGTSVWGAVDATYRGEQSEEFRQTSFPKYESLHADVSLGLITANTLRDKYGAEFPKLELTDYGILSNIMESHPEPLSSRKERLNVIALIHPDRNITGNNARSHELYILALRILNITL